MDTGLVTPHSQRERGKVIGVGVHIIIYIYFFYFFIWRKVLQFVKLSLDIIM